MRATWRLDRPGGRILPAELLLAVIAGLFRAGSIGLGAGGVAGNRATSRHPAVAVAVLAVLAIESTVLGARAVRRFRSDRRARLVDDLVARVETVAGIPGLLLVAWSVPPALRTHPAFWIQPYTVISAIVVGLGVRRAAPGLLAAGALGAVYLLAVGPGLGLDAAAGRGATAAAVANAVSYPAFCALAVIGSRIYRGLDREERRLGWLLEQQPAEQARLAEATRAYRIGHDIPKAFLRELARAQLTPEQLRTWSVTFRDDLLRTLNADPRQQVDLCEELTRLVGVYERIGSLRADLTALGQPPAGAPTLVLVEAVREALNNATYHRFGFPVTVVARTTAAEVEVEVTNGGPGISSEVVTAQWELKGGAISRLRTVGGNYELRSNPRREGTQLRLALPLHAA